MNRLVHTATLPLDRGTVDVTTDPERRSVAIVPRRTALGVPTTWLLPIGGLLAVLALAVALAGSSTLGSWSYALGLGLGLLALSAPALLGRTLPGPALTLLPNRNLLRVRDLELDLDDVRVEPQLDGWVLVHRGGARIDIGAQWGPVGATWLAQTIDHARDFALDQIALDLPPPLRPRPWRISTLPVTLEPDYDGLEAKMDLYADRDDIRGPGFEIVLSAAVLAILFVYVGNAELILIWSTLPIANLAPLVSRVLRRRWDRRHRHARVRIDATTLHYVENGQTHRVPLAAIAAVHVGLRALQVDRRAGPSFWLGHGWPIGRLRELARALDEARAIAPAEAVTVPGVPEALARLRRTTE
ncbi:MAG: hypothetical protein AAF211_31165 [Myxococcota bacterium]